MVIRKRNEERRKEKIFFLQRQENKLHPEKNKQKKRIEERWQVGGVVVMVNMVKSTRNPYCREKSKYHVLIQALLWLHTVFMPFTRQMNSARKVLYVLQFYFIVEQNRGSRTLRKGPKFNYSRTGILYYLCLITKSISFQLCNAED